MNSLSPSSVVRQKAQVETVFELELPSRLYGLREDSRDNFYVCSQIGEIIKFNAKGEHSVSLTLSGQPTSIAFEIKEDEIIINAKDKYKSVNVKTQPYPGFPTDLQQPIIPFLTRCRGTSTVEETIYENRFQNIYDTNRMGASIIVKNNKIAKVKGITPLQGKNVTATDLRGGASMLICGLIANGTTTIDNVKYILRGYDDICGKLTKVGAKIELI